MFPFGRQFRRNLSSTSKDNSFVDLFPSVLVIPKRTKKTSRQDRETEARWKKGLRLWSCLLVLPNTPPRPLLLALFSLFLSSHVVAASKPHSDHRRPLCAFLMCLFFSFSLSFSRFFFFFYIAPVAPARERDASALSAAFLLSDFFRRSSRARSRDVPQRV